MTISDERNFIINLAVTAFNVQFGFNYNPIDFDVVAIPENTNSHCGFEIYTTRFDDYLRMRLYCNFGSVNTVGTYRLNVDTSIIAGLGDEVFVADAVLDNEFLYSGSNFIRMSCPELGADISRLQIMITEDEIQLTFEDGEDILLEEAA